jgi:hypothetical protein
MQEPVLALPRSAVCYVIAEYIIISRQFQRPDIVIICKFPAEAAPGPPSDQAYRRLLIDRKYK